MMSGKILDSKVVLHLVTYIFIPGCNISRGIHCIIYFLRCLGGKMTPDQEIVRQSLSDPLMVSKVKHLHVPAFLISINFHIDYNEESTAWLRK